MNWTARIPPVATPRARLPHRHLAAVHRQHGRAVFLKGIFTVVLALAVTPIAHAEVFTVHTNAELDYANYHVRPGDVVLLADGTFDGYAIAPDSAGTAGARIAYIGNLASPGNVVVTRGISPKSYLTVKGVRVGGSLLEYVGVHHDSLVSCIVDGDLHLTTVSNSVFESLRVEGAHFRVGQYSDGGHNTEACTIQSCQFPNLRSTSETNDWGWVTGTIEDHHVTALYKRVVGCQFRFNRFDVVLEGEAAPCPPAKHYMTQNCTFYGNWMHVTAWVSSVGANESYWICWRDSSGGNTIVRDTIIVENAGSPIGMVAFYSGSGGEPGGMTNNTIDSCYWKVDKSADGVFHIQEPMPGLRLTNNQFMAGVGHVLDIAEHVGANPVIHHNTFYSQGEQLWRNNGDNSDPWDVPQRMSGNLLAAESVPDTCLDVVALMREYHTTTPGDSSYYFRTNGVPQSALWPSSLGCRAIEEPHSRWADPGFADTRWASLDLTPTTQAMGDSCLNWPGLYAGALAYRQPPRAVTDATCEVGKRTVAVRWTTPCHLEPTPAHYELRYALTPITDLQQFQAARFGASGTAEAPGIVQCGRVASLQPCTRYYFAVVLSNEYGSAPVSNTLYATLKCSGFEVECDAQRRPVRTAAEPPRPGLPSPLSASAAQPLSLWLGAGDEDAGRPYVVELFDVAGRREVVLAAGVIEVGQASVTLAQGLAGRGLRPGVHFLRVRIGESKQVRTVVLTP